MVKFSGIMPEPPPHGFSRRPEDSAFNQQRLHSWWPKVTLNGLIAIFFVLGLLLVPLGALLLIESDNVKEFSMKYDSSDGQMDVPCSISEANANGNCSITYSFTEDVTGPLYVYYEISNFYQNHRRYVKSRSSSQLMGGSGLSYDDVYDDCFPLVENGSMLLNPCGLIANSFFNGTWHFNPVSRVHPAFNRTNRSLSQSFTLRTDVITLSSSNSGVELDEDGITWPADLDVKFKQIDGFVSASVNNYGVSCTDALGADYSDCNTYTDSDGTIYKYWYPDDDTVQYLYESYPDIVSPLDGVENEHFIAWMRTAGLPYFRKLYGKIDTDVSAGDSMTFSIATNFEVTSFGGSKSLVLTTLAEFGGKNIALGSAYVVIGSISLFIGILFVLKRCINPRQLGDIKSLNWKG